MRKQVLSIKTAAEWLLTENSVPVSVCACYPLSSCMCVSQISPEHSDGIISQSVEEDGNRGRKAHEYGIMCQNLPLAPQPHTAETGEDCEPGAVSVCSDVP